MKQTVKLNDYATLDFSSATVGKAYDRWAPIYDLVFGKVFGKGRQAAVAATNNIGGRVLEVGVGTGISLPQYRSDIRLSGIDISEAMLDVARKRVADLHLHNVETLAVMDAQAMQFPDASFDVVMAQYVVTAVADPEATLHEFARVLRPGGEIILLSRVSADAGIRQFFERTLAPITGRLGWRTEFSWSRYAEWVDQADGIHLVERRAVPPLGHFSLIRFGKATTS